MKPVGIIPWTEEFFGAVARRLVAATGGDFTDVLVIFPLRRAARHLCDRLAALPELPKPMLAPRMTAIGDWLAELGLAFAPCPPERLDTLDRVAILHEIVRELADAVCSTEKMITHCCKSPAHRFIVVTESGIIHRMEKECPGKTFNCAPTVDVMQMPTDGCRCSECRYMKMNTLEKLRDCLTTLEPRIEMPAHLLKRARTPIERMLAA